MRPLLPPDIRVPAIVKSNDISVAVPEQVPTRNSTRIVLAVQTTSTVQFVASISTKDVEVVLTCVDFTSRLARDTTLPLPAACPSPEISFQFVSVALYCTS